MRPGISPDSGRNFPDDDSPSCEDLESCTHCIASFCFVVPFAAVAAPCLGHGTLCSQGPLRFRDESPGEEDLTDIHGRDRNKFR